MSKIQPVVTKGRKTPFGRKERTTYSPYKEKAEIVQNNTRKKRPSPKKKKETENVWLSGRLHIEGRSNEGPRLQRKHKKDENGAKQNKTNVTPEQDVMTSDA